MLETLGSLIGSLLNIVGSLSHLIIIIFRNLLLLSIILAAVFGALFGIYKLLQAGYRTLLAMTGKKPSQAPPEDKPKDSP
ncbi:MAG TPA: hypothetical protein VFG05_08025 [Methylocella sp.]|nr:hypothetical protein [Methylocella sp.]